jgi:A/G-specific adenine glycosylase
VPPIRAALLRWYAGAKRDLPWRRTRDPYAIWVSEIMLQQTRVETVIPYYSRFLARFPDLRALAAANEDGVLSAWSGLGYYRRARLLHAGAREAVASHGAKVPEDAAARIALPGIGRYTAGAIGSIAFDREEPIVDGNVARVLSRLHAITTPLGTPATEKRLWSEATALVRGPDPGSLNQALMELGATICTPTSPRCGECPVRGSCRARKEGRTAELPVARAKKPPVLRELVAVVARPPRARAIWMVRGKDSLFGGLFGVPMGDGIDASGARSALRAHELRGTIGEELGVLEHVLTHRRLRVRVFAASARGEASSDRRLLDGDALQAVGVATLTRKILALARA